MEALLGFIFKAGTLALEAIGASEEKKKQLRADADEAWADCRAKSFGLEETLEERNIRNMRRAEAKDATESDTNPGKGPT